MIEILICDDQEIITKQLSQLVQEYTQQHKTSFWVKSYQSGEQLITYLQKEEPMKRIILLDIEMPIMNGLEVAKYIRHDLKDYASEIIFVTGTNGYERNLFQVKPSGFIPKPIKRTQLFETLGRSYQLLETQSPFFNYSQNGIDKSILLDNILYFESHGRKKVIVSQHHNDWFYENMSQLNQRLEEYPQFVHCHRSYIVNVNHVVRIDGSDLVMENKQLISVKPKERARVEHVLLELF